MELTPLSNLAMRSPLDALNTSVPQAGQSQTSTKDAARMFEGMLMTQLFQAMRKTVPHSGLFGDDSNAQKTYEYLLDQAVLDHAVNSGRGWGLSDRLEEAWSRNQTAKKE